MEIVKVMEKVLGKISFNQEEKMFNLLNKVEKNINKILNSHEKRFFIFGLPKAGKSTVLSSLVRYIIHSPTLKYRRDPIKNKEGISVFREWNMSYSENNFPLQTPINEYVKLHIEYQQNNSEAIERIVMYEIAGEDVIKMDPTHDSHAAFPLELKKFLFQSDGIIIIASSSAERSREEEILHDFLEYLLRSKIQIPICFILTKYDLIEQDYNNYIDASRDKYKNIIDLLRNYEESEVLSFSIGEVKDNKIIKDNSWQYSSEIFNWIQKA